MVARLEVPETAAQLGLMQGWPPPPERRVTRANWERPPYSRWAFQNMERLFPVADVWRGAGPVLPLEHGPALPLEEIQVEGAEGGLDVGRLLELSYTEGFLVLHDGRIVAERYLNGFAPQRRHLLASVTKSHIGLCAATLVARGELDPLEPLGAMTDALAGTSFAEATLRSLLDMTAGTRFDETYANPQADIRDKGQVDGWDLRLDESLPDNVYDYLKTLPNERPHGAAWSYRSCLTDVLGWVLEVHSGRSLPDLLSDLLWQGLGAERSGAFMTGPAGNPVADGGLLTTLRDQGRFGQLLLEEGRVGGRQVVPAEAIRDCRAGDAAARAAFAASPAGAAYWPGSFYRNQFWVPEGSGRYLLCLGVYGQLVWVDFEAGVVAVKFSSLPVALDARWRELHIGAFKSIARHLG